MMLQFFQALISHNVGAQLQVLDIVWKETSAVFTIKRGAGTGGFIIWMKAHIATDANPVDTVEYDAGPFGAGDELGDGNFVVHKDATVGAGQTVEVTVTGLSRDTAYGYKAAEYSSEFVYQI